MSDEISFGGKSYVSSKRASKISGYAQDYIGQLARSGQIEAQRVGGLWYVSMDSLLGYRKVPEGSEIGERHMDVPSRSQTEVPLAASGDVDSLISFDGKDYISASRASKVTGYNQDYVGQLARSGQTLARQVGNRWYVDREGLLSHKQEKDALLAAVQAESVGLPEMNEPFVNENPREQAESPAEEHMKYYPDEGDLMPALQKEVVQEETRTNAPIARETAERSIPIRLIKHSVPVAEKRASSPLRTKRSVVYAKTGALAAAALTVVIVLSFGVAGLKNGSTYVVKPALPSSASMTASVATAVDHIAAVIESIVSPELVFIRD